METIQFKIIEDIEQAQKYWELLSYKETLFDLWVFRYSFYKYDNFPLHFILGEINGEPIGLLPLQRDTTKNFLQFFGGFWMEDNKVFIKPEHKHLMPKFYEQIHEPAKLVGINPDDDFTRKLPLDGYKYQLDISQYKSYRDFIKDKFEPDTQHKFRKKIKKIEQYKVEIQKNNLGDIELLFKFSKIIFGADSSFHDPKREALYRDMLTLGLDVYLFTFLIDGKKQAVSLCIKYNDIMYAVNSGINRTEVPDLNSYCSLIKIDEAIKSKCKTFDALMGSFGWKEPWHFKPTAFNKFTNISE